MEAKAYHPSSGQLWPDLSAMMTKAVVHDGDGCHSQNHQQATAWPRLHSRAVMTEAQTPPEDPTCTPAELLGKGAGPDVRA